MDRTLKRIWYGRNVIATMLAPLSWLFCGIVLLRWWAYGKGLIRTHRPRLPVVIVGNATVGGTGKTPLVIWICRFLKDHGFRPGIVARGYWGKASHWPQQVRPDSDGGTVGDESVVLARRSECPVAVGPKRVAAVEALIRHTDCDVIVSDDGLQHLALARDIQIAVVDGVRGFGNGRCLPAGPLREPPSSLRRADLIVSYGKPRRGTYPMDYEPMSPRRLLDDRVGSLATFAGRQVRAVAGIGDPGRFFFQLRELGLDVLEHPFADHHRFQAMDLDFGDELPVLMTEKDAVKCKPFAGPDHWYLPVDAKLHPQFGPRLLALLQKRCHGQEAA